jgi:hypothetical protein
MRDASRTSSIMEIPVNRSIADGARTGIDFIYRIGELVCRSGLVTSDTLASF